MSTLSGHSPGPLSPPGGAEADNPTFLPPVVRLRLPAVVTDNEAPPSIDNMMIMKGRTDGADDGGDHLRRPTTTTSVYETMMEAVVPRFHD